MTAHLEAAILEAEELMDRTSDAPDTDLGSRFDGMGQHLADIASAHGLDYDTLWDALQERWHADEIPPFDEDYDGTDDYNERCHRDEGRYQGGYRTFRNGTEREDFGSDR